MELNPLLRRAVELGASDIHLKVGLPPILRRDGALSPLEECAILSDKDMDSLIEVVGARSPERLEAFKQTGDLDIAFQEGDLPRFRVNAFQGRQGVGGVMQLWSTSFTVDPRAVPPVAAVREDLSQRLVIDVLPTSAIDFPNAIAVSGQTYTRKIDAQVLSVVAGVAASAAKFSGDVRMLQAHEQE